MAPVVIGKLMGTNHYRGSARRVMALRIGDGVMLDRRPNNPHDSNAVAVLRDEQMLGHIDRVSAAILSSHIDAGTIYTASVVAEAESVPMKGAIAIRRGSCLIKCVPLPPLLKEAERDTGLTIEDTVLA